VDVASMGKLGFDIVASELSESDRQFAKEAVANYTSFKDVVWHGDLYRLVSPHTSDMAALMYVNESKDRAVVFSYLVSARQRLTDILQPVKLAGLDPNRQYNVRETNLYPGSKSPIDPTITYSGEFLMKVGINERVGGQRASVVLEVKALK
jgi:alpha-galactosidase